MSLSTSSDAAPVPAEQVAALKKAAADYVARATGMTLDGSEESLAIVDHYIEKVQAGGDAGRKPEVLRLAAAALGVYLGELIISRFGGRWRIVVEDAEEASNELGALGAWRVELTAAPLLVDPIGMAAEALLIPENEDEELSDGVPGFTLLPAAEKQREALHLALSRLSPVEAEYYYSLTGRFETLTYVVDLLIDLQKPNRESAADADSDAISDDDREAAAAEPPARQ